MQNVCKNACKMYAEVRSGMYMKDMQGMMPNICFMYVEMHMKMIQE